ncbi:hypothetical protein [cf. Phormidesmis sp. LEGE 11477]|uniref:hypothetical protein n=1 Tax=cf. Phormidesmis sp. LEGE 11477 TaxID=1828680 RepID=UPI001881622E|nr:hypothetical protein [cf. Phormidesmis sp. LEGE 11477]MBE9064153.1 hypothetical protein [cf. Phormidesmis sp. LEGE 11477]
MNNTIAISIELKENSDPNVIGTAIALLMTQTKDPEGTAKRLMAEAEKALSQYQENSVIASD